MTKIGWNGKSLSDMLEESERLMKETKRYYGLEKLALKEQDPFKYERAFARLRGALVSARETALHVAASPIVKEIGELCFALYTPEGDSLVVSTGILVHVHTMSEAVKFMVKQNYEDDPGINPGDIFLNNDPESIFYHFDPFLVPLSCYPKGQQSIVPVSIIAEFQLFTS